MDVEWLILADAAQVVGNKLYLLGGGWDNLVVGRPLPVDQRLGLALSLKVPWNETNLNHNFEVEIISEDGTTEEPKTMAKMGGQFQIGRPAGLPPGSDQRFQLALDLGLKIESAGTKTVIARVEGVEKRRLNFSVIVPATTVPKS